MKYLQQLLRPFFLCLLLILSLGASKGLQAQCSVSAAFSIQQPDSCAQQAVTFTAADPSATAYSWSITGLGGPSNGTGRTIVRSFSAQDIPYNMTVQLTVTGVDTAGNPCTVTSTQVLPIKATPVVAVTDNSLNPFNGCTLDSTATTYSASYNVLIPGTGPYTWDFGDGTPSITTTSPTQNHTYNGYGNYFLTVSVSNGECVGRFEQPIFFQLPPIANMNLVGGFNICEDQTIQVQNNTDTSSRKVDRYIWDWGNGDQDTVFNKSDNFYVYSYTDEAVCDSMLNPQGKFTEEVRLIVQNGCGEHYNASPVFVDPLPRAFIEGPSLGCANTLLRFTNESCPETNVLYTWDFGDGSPQLGPFPTRLPVTHAFANLGTYDVRLIACKPACNACDTAIQTVTILPPPTADFTPSPEIGCAPLIVDLDNLSTPRLGASYTWSILPRTGWAFIDSTTENDFEPRLEFQDSGVYVIQLRVDNICGFDIHTDTIRVATFPQITLEPIPDTCGFLDYVPVVSYNPNGNPITSYQWTFSNGSPAASTDSFPAGPIRFLPDTHTVRIRVQNLCGFTSAQQTFVVDTALSFISAGNDFDLCINQDTLLEGLPLGVGSWEGTNVTSMGMYSPSAPGRDTLIYSSGTGACRVADTIIVTVRDIPSVGVITADQFLCEGDAQVLLQASPPGGSWNIPLLPGDFYDPVAQADIYARYTVVDTLGCSNADSLRIVVYENPTVTTRDTTFCQGTTVQTLDFYSPRTGGTGTWIGPKIADPIAGTFLPDVIGSYEVIYRFTNLNNCVEEDTMTITVISGQQAVAGPDISECRNVGSVVLDQATPLGGTWYYGGNALSGNIFDFTNRPGGPNILTYSTGTGSCLSTDTRIVEIRDTVQIDAGPDLLFCDGADTLTLMPTLGNGDWVQGVGFIDFATGLYDPGQVTLGSSDVLIYQDSLNGCASQDIRIITVDSLPTVSFVVDTACVGDPVQFNENTIYANSFFWDFGDGNSSTQANPIHRYMTGGDYTVKLVGTSANGCQDSLSLPIHITQAPTPIFTPSLDSGCAPLTLTFTNQSNARGGSYTWIMGNGDTLTGPNPGPVTYQGGRDDTTYYIRLIITNSCSTVELIDSVKVFPIPRVIMGTDFSEGCSPLLINYANLTTGNPESFLWDLGQGGALDTSFIPQGRYYLTDSLDSVYTVILTATNTCGSDTDSVQILVRPNDLDPILNATPTVGCMPLTVQFTNLSGAPFVSWDYGDGSNVSNVGIQQPIHTFTDSGTYVVKMFVDNGCSKDTGEVTIVVHPVEEVSFVPPDPVCLGDSMRFFALGTNNTTGFRWDFGNGDSSFATDPVYAYSQPGTYRVTLTSFSQFFQCPNTFDTLVTVYDLPPATFSLNTDAGCQPLTVQLSNSPVGLNYRYEFGDSNIATSINPIHVYQDSGDFTLTLITEDANGCKSDTSATIRVHPLPLSDFMASADTACGPSQISFTNLSTNPVSNFWDFGTGNSADTSVLLNPDFFFPAPGTYDVMLSATTIFGCRDAVTKPIRILPQPNTQIVVDTQQGCEPLWVDFSQNSTGASHYRWDFGDNSSPVQGDDPAPHPYFGGDISYTATLIADTAGFCFDTSRITIQLASAPTAAFDPSNQQACGADTVQFTNLSTSAIRPLSYVWDFGNGNQSFAVQPPIQIYPNPQVYDIQLIATNDFGCRDTVIHALRVHPQPQADFALSDSLACVSEEIFFTNLSSNYSNSLWRFGDNTLSSEDSPSHIYGLNDVSIFVSLTVDTAGFCFDSIRKRIQIASLPEANFDFGPNNFCGGARVQFNNLSTTQAQPLSYRWTFGNGLSSAELNPATDYSVSDTITLFPVQLISTNTFGCSDTAVQEVRGIPQPVAAFEPVPSAGCSDLEVQFANFSQDYTNSQWNFGNGRFSTDQNPTTSYPAGTYSVSLLVNYANLCFDEITLTDVINVSQSAEANFDFDIMVNDPPDGTVAFRNLSQNANTFVWIFGDGSAPSTELDPIHQYFVNDTFAVSLIANNDINCPDTLTREVRPKPFGGVQIPNAFSPESGVDSADVFLPVAIGLVEWDISVYDSWGNEVWRSTLLGAPGTRQEGRPIESWDGTIHKNPDTRSGGPITAPNVFTWKIHKAVFKIGGPYRGKREGTVTVIR